MNFTNSTNATTILPSTAEPTITSAPLVDVDAGEDLSPACSLCRQGLSLPDPSRRFINVADDALNCGGLDDLFRVINDPIEYK